MMEFVNVKDFIEKGILMIYWLGWWNELEINLCIWRFEKL